MTEKIYKFYKMAAKEAWHHVPEDEKQALFAKWKESFERVGAKNYIQCNSAWSSEPWLYFGVQEYPDMAAVQEHANDMLEIGWFRYFDGEIMLGTKIE